MTAKEALRVIQEFVDLAAKRRVGSLPKEQRARLETLDERLRELIEGAKPKPRNIENPSAVKSMRVGGLAEELDRAIDSKEQKKIRDVSTADLPRSFYTPPSVPAFMADYYDEGLVPTPTSDLGHGAPKEVVRADGSAVELMDEVKVLFGLAEPPPARETPARRTSAPVRERRTSANTGPQLGRPAIVHYVAGATKRGEIAPFEPHTGKLFFLEKDGSVEEVELGQVLAVFLGLLKGEEPSENAGERLIITLINDKRVTGMTKDYEEGGSSLTLVPDPRRGNIDKIWIPASAVKAIEIG
jgi:hypothetical protein